MSKQRLIPKTNEQIFLPMLLNDNSIIENLVKTIMNNYLVKCEMIHCFKNLYFSFIFMLINQIIYLNVYGISEVFLVPRFFEENILNKGKKKANATPLRQEGRKIQNETCSYSHNTYCCPGPWL